VSYRSRCLAWRKLEMGHSTAPKTKQDTDVGAIRGDGVWFDRQPFCLELLYIPSFNCFRMLPNGLELSRHAGDTRTTVIKTRLHTRHTDLGYAVAQVGFSRLLGGMLQNV
jgi:hypothetical protein